MKALEEKILKEGQVLPGNILKVGNFLNHQLDVDFLMEMGEEIAKLFQNKGINKIVTIETSGIAIAMAAAAKMHIPVVFAKKNKTSNISSDVYSTMVHSFTHNADYKVVISKQFLSSRDVVLIVDDFLAIGNAINGLIEICEYAGAEVKGIAIAIEKGFQGGGDKLRAKGYHLESLALIDSMSDNSVEFRK